jgi:hypothetical protein
MPTYSIQMTAHDNILVSAAGSFGLIAYAAKEGLSLIKDEDGEFGVRIVETTHVDGEIKREVVKVDADADTVEVVVKRKLAKERKQNAPTAPLQPEDPRATEDPSEV